MNQVKFRFPSSLKKDTMVEGKKQKNAIFDNWDQVFSKNKQNLAESYLWLVMIEYVDSTILSKIVTKYIYYVFSKMISPSYTG